MSLYEEARDKLNRESKAGKYDRHAEVMKTPVKNVLIDLCRQSENFARHIVEGRSFEECMKKVAENVGSHISDLAAFDRAVKYYWPEAKVSYSIKIEDPGATEPEPVATPENLEPAAPAPAFEILDLGAFL